MQKPENYIETQVLQNVSKGDEAAFRLLFNNHWQNIFGVAYMLTKSVPIAEDMVQEVFMKLWMKREELPEVKNFRNYLFIVARNHIFNELKKKSIDLLFTNSLLESFNASKETPEDKLLQKETQQIIAEVVDHLPQQQKIVYRMSHEDGMSRHEMSERLGISPNTVRNHLAKALEMIRLKLQQSLGFVLLYITLKEFLP